jgi:hypothetical protein
MVNVKKYEKLKNAGKSPREIYLAAKADGVGEVNALCLLRDVFGLSIVEAKDVMSAENAFVAPQKVEVGETVYWEGADTIDGFWIMEAKVKKIEDDFAYVCDHKKFLVRPEGLIETPATGALLRIPLPYFEKSLLARLQESSDFWGQLNTLSKTGTP